MFDTIAISVQFPTKKYFLENCTWTISKGVFFIEFMMNLFFILGLGDSSIAQFPKISILLASFRFVTISLAIKKIVFLTSNPIHSLRWIAFSVTCQLQCMLAVESERESEGKIDRSTATIQIVYFSFLFGLDDCINT